MGILSRINDIIRSNLNQLVAKAENPEKLLRQAILDMEDHLRKARKQVTDSVASEKQLEKKRASILERASRWERRAEMALGEDDEDLARQALLRKEDLDGVAAGLGEQIRLQREYVGALKQGLASLDERIREARSKKNALIERTTSAKERRKTATIMDPVADRAPVVESRAHETFERMEDRVLELESRVEAYVEMAEPLEKQEAENHLDNRFAAMEKNRSVEEKMAALKQKLGQGQEDA